jgi:hypothetical protein
MKMHQSTIFNLTFVAISYYFSALASAAPCDDDPCLAEHKSCKEDPEGCCEGLGCFGYNFYKSCQEPPTCLAEWHDCSSGMDCCDKRVCIETKAGFFECQNPQMGPDCSSESTSHSVCGNDSQKYAIHAGTTVTFAGVATAVDGGNVGVSPGTSITMADTLGHKGGIIATKSTDFAAHKIQAHADAMATTPTSTTAKTEIGGQTFTPGTHKFISAINIAFGTTVTLDGAGDYLFQAGSTLVTAADTYFILINGAKAKNVLWALGTAATLGARSVVEGSILAGTSITFGAQSEIRGCSLALAAVTFSGEGVVNLHSQPSPVCAAQSLSHTCHNFAVHARTAVTFAAGGTIDGGDVGVCPGTAITGAAPVKFHNGKATSADSTDFALSVVFAHAAAIAHRVDSTYKGMAIELGGDTFTPGTYRVGSAMNLAASTFVTLDGDGDPNSKFLFQAGTTLITGANTHVKLINGAQAKNVVWALGSAATLGANSIVEGSIWAGTSISFGDQSEVHGCALALAAVTFSGAASVILPNKEEIDGWEFISNMYEAGNPEKDLASKAYKKCVGKTMCVKVLAEAGNTIAQTPGDTWIKDYDSELSGFKYVDQDGKIDWIMEGDKCVGWENCFDVPAFGVAALSSIGLSTVPDLLYATRASIEIHANYGEGDEAAGRTTSTGKRAQGYMDMEVCQ